jgi:hypothetical protein
MCNAQYCHSWHGRAASYKQRNVAFPLQKWSRERATLYTAYPAGRGDHAMPTAANHSATWSPIECGAEDRRTVSLAPNLRTGQLHAPADFIPWKMPPDIH